MAEGESDARRLFRSLVSEGWADEDAEIVKDLLEQARHLASLVIIDPGASPETRSLAADLADRLRADTAGTA